MWPNSWSKSLPKTFRRLLASTTAFHSPCDIKITSASRPESQASTSSMAGNTLGSVLSILTVMAFLNHQLRLIIRGKFDPRPQAAGLAPQAASVSAMQGCPTLPLRVSHLDRVLIV